MTQELRTQGLIHGRQAGRQWLFYADESAAAQPALSGQVGPGQIAGGSLPPADFEALARRVMGIHFDTPLEAMQPPGIPKKFDLVSKDGRIVGDAKYINLVFGNDPEAPRLWLARYGNLLSDISFYFLSGGGELTCLTKTHG